MRKLSDERIKSTERFSHITFWHRHPPGFDGMLQEGWSIVFMAPIQKTESEENAKVFIMLRGDDLLLIVARPTRHGVAAGEVYNNTFLPMEPIWIIRLSQ